MHDKNKNMLCWKQLPFTRGSGSHRWTLFRLVPLRLCVSWVPLRIVIPCQNGKKNFQVICSAIFSKATDDQLEEIPTLHVKNKKFNGCHDADRNKQNITIGWISLHQVYKYFQVAWEKVVRYESTEYHQKTLRKLLQSNNQFLSHSKILDWGVRQSSREPFLVPTCAKIRRFRWSLIGIKNYFPYFVKSWKIVCWICNDVFIHRHTRIGDYTSVRCAHNVWHMDRHTHVSNLLQEVMFNLGKTCFRCWRSPKN